MGCLWARIGVRGTVAHSALTNKPGTINAIAVARELLNDLDAWTESFQNNNIYRNEKANVTVACIRGGTPWRISRNPYECFVYLDIRTVPGQRQEDVKRDLRAVLRAFADKQDIAEPSLDFLITDPWLVLDEELPVVQAANAARKSVMGDINPPFIRRPGADAIHLTRYDVPCVQFGPGGRMHPDVKGVSMHDIGDHVLLDDVVTASRVYLAAALDLCSRQAPTTNPPEK
jgi:acetylornithine deacetylase